MHSQYGLTAHWGCCVTGGTLTGKLLAEAPPPSVQLNPSRCLTSVPLLKSSLRTAEAIFNEFRDKDLKPAYLADADPNRALLDRRVVCDLLGFDEDTYAAVRRLAAKWCAEPSVHGGKARPRDAKLMS